MITTGSRASSLRLTGGWIRILAAVVLCTVKSWSRDRGASPCLTEAAGVNFVLRMRTFSSCLDCEPNVRSLRRNLFSSVLSMDMQLPGNESPFWKIALIVSRCKAPGGRQQHGCLYSWSFPGACSFVCSTVLSCRTDNHRFNRSTVATLVELVRLVSRR